LLSATALVAVVRQDGAASCRVRVLENLIEDSHPHQISSSNLQSAASTKRIFDPNHLESIDDLLDAIFQMDLFLI